MTPRQHDDERDPVAAALAGLAPDQRAAALRAIAADPPKPGVKPYQAKRAGRRAKVPKSVLNEFKDIAKSGLTPQENRERRQAAATEDYVVRLTAGAPRACHDCGGRIGWGEEHAVTFNGHRLCGTCAAARPRWHG